MHVLVAVNPIAGRGRGRRDAEQLERALAARGCTVERIETRAEGSDAALRAAASRADRAVIVGGDGTLARALPDLPRHLPVALLPRGTANVLALDLRLPRQPEAVAVMVASGREVDMDLARVNGRLSFLCTGVGFDGAVVRHVEQRRHGRPISKLFYVRSVLRCLARNRPTPLAVEVDGAALPEPAGWVLITNLIGYGGVLRLCPDRILDDGAYEVFLFPRGTRRALIGYGLRGLLRRLPGGSVKMLRAGHVRVSAAAPVPYQVDGDYGGQSPVEVEVTGKQRLIVP